MRKLQYCVLALAILYFVGFSPSASAQSCSSPATPPVVCTIWSSSATPVFVDGGDPTAGEYGVKFRADVDGTVIGIRFYKSVANTGTHIVNLWTSPGTLLATAPVSGETASGWQQFTFSSPVAITAGVTYVASYFAPRGHYSFNSSYFASGVDNPPLHALANSISANAVYNYGASSAFPQSTYFASNYWVDVAFVPNAAAPPAVTFTSPANAATFVSLGAVVNATFNEPMDATTINGSTMLLVDSSSNPVAGAVTYNGTTSTATFKPTVALQPLTTYTATVKGLVKDLFGNVLGPDFVWSFTTGTAPANSGPGGPILVISSAANPFTRYYTEILLAEGLNYFTVQDVSTVTSSTLAAYDVAILGDMSLTSTQVSMITTWVNNGGNLIAMHPDKQLAGLLGLTSTPGTLSDAYLQVDTTSGPGVGIVSQTMQYHSSADLYSLNGASSLATLYSGSTTPTASPAVTLVGAGAGQAAAFTYDLARSVVYTRQGNPAWSGQERDAFIDPDVGGAQIRSDDLFFGNASFDPQPDWVNLSKVAIPQADEQQRLLVNLLQQINLNKKPLPRLWYFPRGFKAVVIMTGDDHGFGGSRPRFDTYITDSPANCSAADWQCVRGTTYIWPSTPFSSYQVYVAQGFEIANHGDNAPTCTNFTPSSLDAAITSQLAAIAQNFPDLPAPRTNRTHCVLWSDYDSEPQILLNHGIRLDTSYYYWPGAWIQDRPGMFTGSGMPMRFADRSGNIIDVYQATTQLTDESGQTYPKNIDTLLDNALGASGFYGAFTANMHTDLPNSPGSDAIVASAQARGVPIVSALQMLTWLDGRNASSFGGFSWNGSTLSFTITVGTGARNLQAMLPVSSNAGSLTSIRLNGSPISFSTQTIKGVQYAYFNASGGAYQAVYGSGVPVALASLSPATVSFGNQLMNTTSGLQTVTLSNTGGAALTISGISITGANPGDFAQTNNCGALPATLAAGGSCTINLTFTPAATGVRNATLSVSDSDPTSPQTVSLSGTGTEPIAGISPATLLFGDQPLNTTSAAQPVTLSNTGSAALAVNGITITGANSGEFSQSNNCGVSVAAGTSCTINVTFTPTLSGARSATLSVSDSDTTSPQTVALSGTGIILIVSVSPTTLPFSDQLVNTASVAQLVTLSNTGSAALAINGITITGANPGDFSQTNNCGTSVAAGTSCTISVIFQPAAAGVRSAALSVSDSDPTSPQTVSLSGTGTAPAVGVSPTTVSFGNQLVNATSGAQVVTISSTGTSPLLINSITIAGTNAGDFAQTNNCGSSLAPGSSCTINVTFAPTAAGLRSATLSISDNVPGTPTVALSGTGVAPVVSLSRTSITFATRLDFTTSSATNVTVRNTGTATLTLNSITITGTNAGDFSRTTTCGATLGAGLTCTISVRFTPQAAGTRTAVLSISDNALGSPHTVSLSGTGTAVSRSPASITFTARAVGTVSGARAVTLTNVGPGSLAINGITITGTNPGDFQQTNACGSSLAAGTSCTINVKFAPQATGTRTAILQISDLDPTSPQKVNLSGTGQ
jgi:hypothetical protein